MHQHRLPQALMRCCPELPPLVNLAARSWSRSPSSVTSVTHRSPWRKSQTPPRCRVVGHRLPTQGCSFPPAADYASPTPGKTGSWFPATPEQEPHCSPLLAGGSRCQCRSLCLCKQPASGLCWSWVRTVSPKLLLSSPAQF